MTDIMDLYPDYVIPEPNSGCWLWTAGTISDGYGRVRTKKPRRMTLAHRLSFQCSRGDVPDHLYVLHTCDTPACVNPDHLFLGTQFDNMGDCKRKGRMLRRRGINSSGMFTPAQLAELLAVRGRFKRGQREELAQRFGVSVVAITNLRSRHKGAL